MSRLRRRPRSRPFRDLCRHYGAGLCVSEMVAAHLVVSGCARTLRLAGFGAAERPRSVQLYGTEPAVLAEAARILVDREGVEHVDLNFGCPVRKVTVRGGGAAIPLQPRLVSQLVAACVKAAGPSVPVTVKMRLGISEELLTYKTAGIAAQDGGATWVGLHARTAEQLYSPPVRWEAIATLAAHLSIPVLGNGDVLECWDALRMMRETGAAGVIIGRGCLGRQGTSRELKCVFAGQQPPPPPCLGETMRVAFSHLQALVTWEGDEHSAVLQMRKMVPLYLLGYSSAAALEVQLMQGKSVRDWEVAMASKHYNPAEPFPLSALRHPRLKGAGMQKVAFPEGFLQSLHKDKGQSGGMHVSYQG
eukprot:SM000023S07565  [mRNA]  locus=s23:145254:148113:- [translate_table: standard]